jgi:AcrR family transcriptional regulator
MTVRSVINNNAMPRTPEQYEQMRQEKRRKIMDVALELFASEGYHATSVAKIAEKADISKGLLYNYFESKDDLLKEIAQVGFQDVYENLDINHDGVLTEEEFVYFIDRLIEIINKNKKFWLFYTHTLMQPNVVDFIGTQLRENFVPVVQILMNYLREEGFEDPAGELFFLSSTLKGATLQLLFSPLDFDISPVRDRIVKLYAKNTTVHHKI